MCFGWKHTIIISCVFIEHTNYIHCAGGKNILTSLGSKLLQTSTFGFFDELLTVPVYRKVWALTHLSGLNESLKVISQPLNRVKDKS